MYLHNVICDVLSLIFFTTKKIFSCKGTFKVLSASEEDKSNPKKSNQILLKTILSPVSLLDPLCHLDLFSTFFCFSYKMNKIQMAMKYSANVTSFFLVHLCNG